MVRLSWTIFFRYKPLFLLSSTCWPFSLCKICKTFLQRIQSFEDAPFLGPKCSISPLSPAKKKLFLFLKIISTIFIYLLAPFIVQNFKKNTFNGSRVIRMRNFWARNGPFAQIRIFQRTVLWTLFLSFMPIYMTKIKVRY